MSFFETVVYYLEKLGTFVQTILEDIGLMAEYVAQSLSAIQDWYGIIPAVFLPGIMAVVGVGVVLRILDLI